MDMQAYLLPLQIVQALSSIAPPLSLSLFPFSLTLTTLRLHLLNKILALILGLSSVFLENIG